MMGMDWKELFKSYKKDVIKGEKEIMLNSKHNHLKEMNNKKDTIQNISKKGNHLDNSISIDKVMEKVEKVIVRSDKFYGRYLSVLAEEN